MQQFTVELPDEVAARLRQFASERRQSPEESLAVFAETELAAKSYPTQAQTTPPTHPDQPTADDQYPDPWEGFHGAFQSPYPDLTINHDYYLAAEAIDPHNPTEETEESNERK